MTELTTEIPPLVHGERLDADEFLRRYENMPDLKKAELIDNIVYLMSSPVSLNRHGVPHAHLLTWANTFAINTPHIIAADNATVRMNEDNAPQPDVLMFIEPAAGGQSASGEKDYLYGAPEFAAEISHTTVHFDKEEKREVFERAGVLSYLIWDTENSRIDWLERQSAKDKFTALTTEDNIYQSAVFPGLWLNAQAMLEGRYQEVVATLQKGLDSAGHADFVARLETAADSKR